MQKQASIIAKDLAKSFTTGSITIAVLKGLSIEIYPGEMTLIIGPSGCGKSTLLALLSGLNRQDRGDISVLGQRLSALDDDGMDDFRLQNSGFIFQGFNLFPSLSALEQVILPLQYLGLDEHTAEQKAKEALSHVGLAPRMHLRPAELSGGEKQRVAIARVLAKEPKILFADEPTSALDKVSGQNVVDILQHTAHEKGTTVLCVSHDQRLIAHADRVLSMEDGMIHSDTHPDKDMAARFKSMEHAYDH
ncbi:ABC transporter ATP-binding protein [Methylomonas sp. EFPC3]|uniref:ABC transporter ATP-binding protein n=1 Tax=Methylomonas sp. EFPC3 TaxID=3021710 RepID=UPI002415E598|nr:ABC transporter ATP-binding protein [Methylomonas sp. EFPC3]WFP51900.1 ABC transporter ATP-binding protein [Methylomonas sp. EFPC3]